MTLTTHATVGTLIGYSIGDPVAGFVLGFISHLLLDMVPHGDHDMNINFRVNKTRMKRIFAYGMVDTIAAIFLILILINWKDLVSINAISWAIAGAILPDLLIGLHDLTKWKWLEPFNKLHFYFHDFFIKKRGDIRLRYSLIGQAVLIIILINLL